MSRVDDKNRGWVGHRGRSAIRPAEEVCSTLIATHVPPDDVRSRPDTSGFLPEIGTEAGESSSGDRAEDTPHRWTDFETDTPMPTPTPSRPIAPVRAAGGLLAHHRFQWRPEAQRGHLRPLPRQGEVGRGGDGLGLAGPAHEARLRPGPEDHRPARRQVPRLARPVRARGQDPGPVERPSEHRRRPRRRLPRGPGVHRDGLRPGQEPGQDRRRRDAEGPDDAPGLDGTHPGPALRRAPVRPRQGDHPPRPEALEPHAGGRPARGPGAPEGPRLRDRQDPSRAIRSTTYTIQGFIGTPPYASPEQADGHAEKAERHLLGGRDPLRAADRQAALHRVVPLPDRRQDGEHVRRRSGRSTPRRRCPKRSRRWSAAASTGTRRSAPIRPASCPTRSWPPSPRRCGPRSTRPRRRPDRRRGRSSRSRPGAVGAGGGPPWPSAWWAWDWHWWSRRG